MIEKRLHTRHRASTRVRVSIPGRKSVICKAVNLSAAGCAIATGGLGLKKGQRATLTFLVKLGTITKMHIRTATVTHVTAGRTGFAMDTYAPPTPGVLRR